MTLKKIALTHESTENMKELFDSQDELIRDVSNKLLNNREKIIIDKLKELNITIDFVKEIHRRFKRFRIEVRGNETAYYYNDGSISGLRIITFVDEQNPISYNSDRVSISMETTYY